MGIIKGIALAVMTLTLPVALGCRSTTGGPYPEQPVARPAGVETPQDAALGNAVKERLAAEKAVDLSAVIVEVRKGTVFLSGVVPSLDARERAVKISWQASGVETVANHLQVAE